MVMSDSNHTFLKVTQTHMLVPPKHTPDSTAGLSSAQVNTILNIKNCFVYVWLKNKREFWLYPIQIQGSMLIGCAWNGVKWSDATIHLDSIKSYC